MGTSEPYGSTEILPVEFALHIPVWHHQLRRAPEHLIKWYLHRVAESALKDKKGRTFRRALFNLLLDLSSGYRRILRAGRYPDPPLPLLPLPGFR